ncbi:Protein CBG07998 [Caenorhabditis briggsae]|uniref:Protein CBG07998 n=1 Tax=Caenorhabditis briggsae TaxID=6238 RepID=A8X5J5_CAEBR|nr:Protein CBG07998 [Caenorhabditis briggsae]CAP27906.2 Protein CBG07998 [Caenorhabditis briggsae]
MPISLLKFPTDLLRDVLKQCNPFELFGEEIEDEVMIYDAVRICKEDGKKAWLKVVLGDVPKLRFLMCKPGNTWVEEIDLSDYEEESEDEV